MKKQTFKQFLIEAPLPDDWDGDIYSERIPFRKRVAYAKERAKTIGTGSARVAFVIPYQGRDTVLKVAKNRKGMAQNEEEVQLLGDWYLRNNGIIIPMIDYDEASASPTWIHVEKAQKAKNSDFKRIMGFSNPSQLIAYAIQATGNTGTEYGRPWKYETIPDNIDEENENVQAFVDYVGNYKPILGDYGRLANWGVYEGRLVIIDIGLTQEVFDSHYSGKR